MLMCVTFDLSVNKYTSRSTPNWERLTVYVDSVKMVTEWGETKWGRKEQS